MCEEISVWDCLQNHLITFCGIYRTLVDADPPFLTQESAGYGQAVILGEANKKNPNLGEHHGI